MDKNLIRKVQENSESAFTDVYNLYKAKLYFYFLKKTRSEAYSADLVQTTFLKLWNYRSRLNGDIALSHQVFRIAKTTLIDLLRQKAREKVLRLEDAPVIHSIPAAPEASRPFAEEVRSTLHRISPQRGKIIQLRLEGWTNQEIAKGMGISKKTVENQLNKAIKEIRTILPADVLAGIFLWITLHLH